MKNTNLIVRKIILLILTIIEVRSYLINRNITFVKQFHEFSKKASVCPNSLSKLLYTGVYKSQIYDMINLQLDINQYFTVVIYTDISFPQQLILWDLQYGNHKRTNLQKNGIYMTNSIMPIYVKDLQLLVLLENASSLSIFKKTADVFDFTFIMDVSTFDVSNTFSPLVTDMFILDNSYELIILDFANSKLLFYDLRYLAVSPYKSLIIPLPDKFSPYPTAFYAKHIPNSNFIVFADFSKAIIRIIDYITSDIVYTSNDHISNIPRYPSILGIYKKDNLVVFYNNQMIYGRNTKQTFQVFSANKQLELISEFFIDYKNSTFNQIQSMTILQNSPHVVTTHTKGDVYIHSLYTGEQIRHFHHDNFTTYDVKFYDGKLIFSTTNDDFDIINYFYDWSYILYPEIRDGSKQGICVSQCGDFQGLNSDLLSCSPCNTDYFCKTCKFPSGNCDSCQDGYYLYQGRCLSYCKGEEGSFNFIEPNQCECKKGYFLIDDNTCISNICQSQEWPEYDYRIKEVLCHRICNQDLFYDIAEDECVCIQGYVKINGSCNLDISSICLIIVFIILLAVIAYKYRIYLTFSKSKVFFEVKDIQQGVKLKKCFEENKRKQSERDSNKNKEKLSKFEL